jgi:thiol-disulfide isomerase/thioredoxin
MMRYSILLLENNCVNYLTLKLKKFIFPLLFLLAAFAGESNAQNTFTVKYLYKNDSTDKTTKALVDSFYFQIFRPAENITENTSEERYHTLLQYRFIKLDSVNRESICTYSVTDTSCAQFFDGFGYESFVIPGDTIDVFIESKKRDDGYWINKNKGFRAFWFHNYSFSGKNKYIYSLFDSLQYFTGPMQFSVLNLQMANLDLNRYFQMANGLYKSRIDFLNDYCLTHSLPTTIYKLAYTEIRSSYITYLVQPIYNLVATFSRADYSKDYIDSLESFRNLSDQEAFSKTFLYSRTVYEYVYTYKNKLLTNSSDDETLFHKTYQDLNIAEKHDPVIRQALLGICLLGNVGRKFNSFPIYLSDFEKNFPNSESYKYLDSLYAIEKSKPVFTSEQALASEIFDNKNEQSTFKQKLTKKPVYVDCWASWCVPCLQQMPFEEDIKKQYAGKVDFIYLSFDKDNDKWMKKAGVLKLGKNSYILSKNFKSTFAYYFEIGSIPRYLLFDGNGKLVTSNAPSPTKKAKLTEILDKTISGVK